ncbi:MAG: sigma factor G inhibitor Gin [Bacillaceae bacterium]|nr:sigma factor G inhibitor Gin [Bacillaceae bacterium]
MDAPAEKEKRMCIVCEKEQEDGLEIWGEFICRSCENEMVNTNVEDKKYPFFIRQMRQIWLKKNA